MKREAQQAVKPIMEARFSDNDRRILLYLRTVLNMKSQAEVVTAALKVAFPREYADAVKMIGGGDGG